MKICDFYNLIKLSLVNTSISTANWKFIVENCPNIENFELECYALTTKCLAIICQQLIHFKSLDLGCGVYNQHLLGVLESCSHFRYLTISPKMYQQFQHVLENAEFEVIVKQSMINPFKIAYSPEMASNSFKSNNKRLIEFMELKHNFQDYYFINNNE